MNIIDSYILNVDKDNKEANQEGMAFFYKMKGDFYRYICECAIDDRLKKVKEEAKKAYDQANEITLQPCTSTKL